MTLMGVIEKGCKDEAKDSLLLDWIATHGKCRPFEVIVSLAHTTLDVACYTRISLSDDRSLQ